MLTGKARKTSARFCQLRANAVSRGVSSSGSRMASTIVDVSYIWHIVQWSSEITIIRI